MTAHDAHPAFSRRSRIPAAGHRLARLLRTVDTVALRVALQAAAAAVLAYLAASLSGLPQPSWAVFSALFTVQSSLDGTIGSAIFRIAGGALGLVVGLAAIGLVGTGGWLTVATLVIGILPMALLAGLRPNLSYGLVTVTMLILAPGLEVLANALLKATEIGLGALCGAVAATLLLPRSARHAEDRHLAVALRQLGALMERALLDMARGRRHDASPRHKAIGEALQAARDTASAGPHFLPGGRTRRARDRLVGCIERLWYTLSILDRLQQAFAPAPLPREAARPIARLAQDCGRLMRQLAGSVERANRPAPRRLDLPRHDDLDWMELHISRSRSEAQKLDILQFAGHQLLEDIEAMVKSAAAVYPLPDRETAGEGAPGAPDHR
ncbi:FUSC family protein [Rhizobium sp. CSW-27]|uniref:FUSC family protein n=1 Tax=Rhizobium sp. CSW-27 TaxID=2839985 RepID=UPI001C03132D|nr:FUSC family protein [Rhizobium sp. CSW-27]MBT9372236.1 FUSC family protein [Rhizobium sp. CSW-27]